MIFYINILFSIFLCLQGLKSLYFLSLDQTKVTDAGMVLYLQSAPSCLSQLGLNQTAVTEATLAVLPTCVPQLRLLSIKQTKVLQPLLHIWRLFSHSSELSCDISLC